MRKTLCVQGNERRLVWPKPHESGWGGGALARGEVEEEERQGLLEDSKRFVFHAPVQREIIKDS